MNEAKVAAVTLLYVYCLQMKVNPEAFNVCKTRVEMSVQVCRGCRIWQPNGDEAAAALGARLRPVARLGMDVLPVGTCRNARVQYIYINKRTCLATQINTGRHM